MTTFSQFALRLARVIAGRDRAEWIEAMATEAQLSGNPGAWATGCLWASIKDRIVREWRFILAVLTFPIGAYLFGLALFYPVAWLLRHEWIPAWTFYGAGLLGPLPFAFLLGRLRPGLPAYLASLVIFPIAVFFPLILFWIEFGKSPFSWFGETSTWYNMTPVAGLTCALLVWFGGVWLGTRWRRRSS